MKIEFDPAVASDREHVASVIALFAGGGNVQLIEIDIPGDAPQPVQATPGPDTQPPASAETDIHGMTHDDSIHSTPPSKNADGSWRAKRGQKDAYEAAIAAHKAQSDMSGAVIVPDPIVINQGRPHPDDTAVASTEAPAAMPAMPAAPAPQTPLEPIDYVKMSTRFVGMMQSGKIADFKVVYNDLQIDYSQLETNQTFIARLWSYMDALDAGVPHETAAGMVMANAG